jgi:hypothetical protein
MASYRQNEVINPHFRLPLQFGGIKGGALVNEQDSSDDVIDCVRAIIAYPVGVREALPEFGIPDIMFRQETSALMVQVRAAIEQWEERVEIDIDGSFPITDSMIWDMLVKAKVIEGG